MTTLAALLRTMRPKQWVKNIFVFVALAFDVKFTQSEPLLRTIAAFLLFCLVSSAVYLLNDVVDREKDRTHPRKRHRPLAAGLLSPRTALIAMALLLVVSLPLGWRVDARLGLILLAYFVVNIAYSFWLKHVVIIDALTVAAGFVLRVVAGVVVVDVTRFSPWLYVCITLGALLIALGKRRAEIVGLEEDASNHRAILDEYSLAFVDQLIGLITAATIVSYSLYTFSAENVPGNHLMMLTIPLALYFFFRYLYLIQVKGLGGAPDELLFQDRPLLLTALLWGLMAVGVLYFSNHHA
ncbi:MAG: decaprenyl-phosphate phosphoribosyltransferase [Caldilineales bacterium]|nr:decaprenyl-phosphate phosphoribosyltransferase [Caldilineales bacterium]